MPRLPINYMNTIIYRLVCKDINITDIYVGHTTKFLNRRYEHKYNCTNQKSKKYNCPVYQFIRNQGNWNNWEMIEIEKYPCNDKREAEKRERYLLEHYKATLNTTTPSRPRAERQKNYYDKYREEICMLAKMKRLEKKTQQLLNDCAVILSPE